MLVVPASLREFELYALALPQGANFEPNVAVSAWKTSDGRSVGVILAAPDTSTLSTLVMRRQVDHRFVVTHERSGLRSEEDALSDVAAALRPDDPPEPLPPNAKRRPLLLNITRRPVGASFRLLTTTPSHFAAMLAVGETYLAMPNPDGNFVSDFQTDNFEARLWELYLLAAFREQGVNVRQDQVSPDFLIERIGHRCYVEAVTAHATERAPQGLGQPVHAPDDHAERLMGAPAVRFAKTMRSKLQREYHNMAHVAGTSFALAIADYHAHSSMVWSREALPTYLFGSYAHVVQGDDGRKAVATVIEHLKGEEGIPAGLFRDPAMADLSAVLFSNAGTLGKFNRMGFLAGWRVPGLTMVREGILFDRTPGALDPIPFKYDILSPEYESLWPSGESWCQELEVFHNPLAKRPIAFDLLPGATHWFEENGEVVCKTIWEHSVLSSLTHLKF